MPAPIDKHWENRAKSLRTHHPNWGATRIAKQCEKEAEEAGRADSPSPRWVGGVLHKWDKLRDTEEPLYRDFHWPESMERGELPWEAGKAGLELMDFLQIAGGELVRPTNQDVRWFYYLSLAAPDLSISLRAVIAEELSRIETAGELQDLGLEQDLISAKRHGWAAFSIKACNWEWCHGEFQVVAHIELEVIPRIGILRNRPVGLSVKHLALERSRNNELSISFQLEAVPVLRIPSG